MPDTHATPDRVAEELKHPGYIEVQRRRRIPWLWIARTCGYRRMARWFFSPQFRRGYRGPQRGKGLRPYHKEATRS
jgi:hypothetical protein